MQTLTTLDQLLYQPPQQLKLSGQVYVLMGSDAYLQTISKQYLCQIIRGQDHTYSHAILDGVKQEPWLQAMQACQPNLFGQQNWCLAQLPNGKPGKKGGECLIELLNEQASFVLFIPSLDKLTQQSAWFTAIKQKACLIQLPNKDERFIKKYLTHHANQLQLKITDGIMHWLLTYFVGDVGAAAQALEKLSLTHQNQTLQLQMVQEYLLGQSHVSIYDISEALWAGNGKQVMHMYKDCMELDSMHLLIWLLTEDLSILLECKMLQAQKLTVDFSSYRLWGKKLQAVQLALKRLSYQQLRKALHQLSLIEMQSKGAILQDVKPQTTAIALERWLIELL